MRRVVAVDDTETYGSIYRDALADEEDIEYLGLITFSDALEKDDWSDADTVLLDLGNRGAAGADEYTGCLVAERIRQLHPKDPGPSPTITVLTNYARLPELRMRAAEAGVDYWYKREPVLRTYAALQQAIRAPEGRATTDGIEEFRGRLGLRPGVTINAAARGLEEAIQRTRLPADVLRRRGFQQSGDRRRVVRMRDFVAHLFEPRNVDSSSNLYRPSGGIAPTKPQLGLFGRAVMMMPDDDPGSFDS